MKRIFKLGTTTYTASARLDRDQVIARLTQMGKADPTVFDRWREVYDSITEDVLMQARIEEITALHAKASKPRKPAVRADSRIYPKKGASASTADYVRDFFKLNQQTGHAYSDFFEPLSTRVTPIEGEYTECLYGS